MIHSTLMPRFTPVRSPLRKRRNRLNARSIVMSNRATEDRPGASNIAVYLTNSRQWKLNVEATPESRNKPEIENRRS